ERPQLGRDRSRRRRHRAGRTGARNRHQRLAASLHHRRSPRLRVDADDRLKPAIKAWRSEEHTSELQSPCKLVCRLLLEKKNRSGGRAHFIATDVADEASVVGMAAEAARVFGRVNVLVNNAAIFVLKGIDATPEEWRQILDVNVMGPVLVAKHVVPLMRKAGGGAIVNIASMSSFIAQPDFFF